MKKEFTKQEIITKKINIELSLEDIQELQESYGESV